ncbi:MAG: hypothetical protein EPO32_07390 [Anaerolineae bacterium]|nr:MAG: hypothetical protein EPO32_07390 [Anaerolineae bacterium]
MTRKQWWLKKLAVVGGSGAIVWFSTSVIEFPHIFTVLVPCLFFFMLGIGMGWILFPVLSPPGRTRSKYAFVFGLSSLFSARISIVISFILAFIYSLVFFLTLDRFDALGITLIFWGNLENMDTLSYGYFASLTLLASLFQAGATEEFWLA